MGEHAFADETKERGYIMAAVLVASAELTTCRQAIQKVILPGQRRVHFKGERPARRGQILDLFYALGVSAVIFDASRLRDPKRARDACLAMLVDYLAEIGAERLVLEVEDAAHQADNVLLYNHVRKVGLAETLQYYHMRAREECLLAMPDGVAWGWARGGRWRAKVQRLVKDVRTP